MWQFLLSMLPGCRMETQLLCTPPTSSLSHHPLEKGYICLFTNPILHVLSNMFICHICTSTGMCTSTVLSSRHIFHCSPFHFDNHISLTHYKLLMPLALLSTLESKIGSLFSMSIPSLLEMVHAAMEYYKWPRFRSGKQHTLSAQKVRSV